jgi:uncharacterized protein (TIGR03435 family)
LRKFVKFAVLALLSSPLFAQAPPAHPAPDRATAAGANAPSTASAPAAPANFIAADVEDPPPAWGAFYFGATIHDDRYILKQATMAHLIATAYNLYQPTYVGGGPAWIWWDRYDIEAKVPPGTTIAAARPMLQNLLAERFKLVVHPGDVPVPAYLLTVGNGKPNLKPSTSEDAGSCQPQRDANQGAGGSTPLIVLECRGVTMEALARTLVDMRGGGYVDYLEPVVDMTGLKGAYDFDLKWTPAFFLPHSGGAGISLFKAIEQQLGLELELKTVLRPGMVIYSAIEQPTPNSPDLAKIMPPLPPPQFEVATIRPAKPGAEGQGKITGDELNFASIPLKFLIVFAWNLNPRDDKMLVAPKWIESDRIDIHAKVASADLGTYSTGRAQTINYEDFRLMIRSLLIDRFQIKFHMEDRPIDGYTLVVADPKLASVKLTRPTPTEKTLCWPTPGPDGKDPRMTNIMLNSLQSCWNTTMDQFAFILHRLAPDYLYFPVKNDTALQGPWDLTLSWSSADLTQGGGPSQLPPPPGQAPAQQSEPAPDDPNGAISFFDALRKELGLKLVKEKMPEPVLVIDQIDQQPTPN